MICIDIFEWMQNDKFSPTRFQAQADAVNLICSAKTQSYQIRQERIRNDLKEAKKNNVALDIVNSGEENQGKAEKLEALLAAVNNNDSSHIVHVPSGLNALSDVLISTPIFTGYGKGGSSFAAASASGISGFDFGVDPNLIPELALALQVSMEEERVRQEAAAKKAAEEAEQQSTSQDETMTENISVAPSQAKNKANDLMSYPMVYVVDLREIKGDVGKMAMVCEAVKEEEVEETKNLWQSTFDEPYEKTGGVADQGTTYNVKGPVHLKVREEGVNKRYKSMRPRLLHKLS